MCNSFLHKEIILASNSPQRKELLTKVGIKFTCFSQEVDEIISASYAPSKVVSILAERKALACLNKISLPKNTFIVAADTIVSTAKNSILGKPKNVAAAKDMLNSLSNSWHKVTTGVCIISNQKKTTFFEQSNVLFKKLTKDEIDYYIDTFNPLDKAGAYGIQDWIGLVGVIEIKGCFYNIVGLPVQKLINTLNTL